MRISIGLRRWRSAAGLWLFGPVLAASFLKISAAEQSPATLTLQTAPNTSLSNEIKRAISQGLAWLEKNQSADGYWSSPEYPAITGLGLTAFRLQPGARSSADEPPVVRKGYSFLLSCVRPDGGIYRQELPSYNTSVSLTALVLANRADYTSAIVNARKFIASLQVEPAQAGKFESPFDGGIGYGKQQKQEKQPDLSNTAFAIEAMASSKSYVKDKAAAEAADLNWPAVIHFIQSCQNLSAYNRQSWVSDDPQEKGGFIYLPGRSMAGETNLASGRVALRSYGSMSYAGLLSYIYADLQRDDPRVLAVVNWLRSNYSLEENPAMGPQGLYYYYHMLAKALSVYGADLLECKNGKTVNWREDLALKLINLQHADGSWSNENGRWFEKDPALVTAYALIALELAYGKKG